MSTGSDLSKVLVTGGAGFIGSHLVEALLARDVRVRILDNLDPFYDPKIKELNLRQLSAAGGDLEVVRGDIRDRDLVERALSDVDAVVHLAALAGVRPSIARPHEYWDVNCVGTQSILDAIAKRPGVALLFGSSSSVYGGNEKVPFHEDDPVDNQVSPYAATKRAGELMCNVHHRLYGNPVWCFRFFTVYGPRQRPEMAIHKFTRRIENDETVPMFGDGSSERDYTYVDDIVAGLVAALERVDGFRIYNLGGSKTTKLSELVTQISEALGKEPKVEHLPDQPGDVPRTWADVSRAAAELDYASQTDVRTGLARFVEWYRAARAEGVVK